MGWCGAVDLEGADKGQDGSRWGPLAICPKPSTAVPIIIPCGDSVSSIVGVIHHLFCTSNNPSVINPWVDPLASPTATTLAGALQEVEFEVVTVCQLTTDLI